MTSHVPNLDLCKRLKEEGYPQETLFSYWDNGRGFYVGKRTRDSWDNAPSPILQKNTDWYAAPLATELAKYLKNYTVIERVIDGEKKIYTLDLGFTNCMYWNVTQDRIGIEWVGTEPNMRAKMWLWLKENNYL